MLDKVIRQAQLQHRFLQAVRGKRFHHRTACAAHDAALFHGDNQVMLGRQLEQQFFIERLSPAHIGDRGIQRFASRQCGVEQSAKRQNGNLFSSASCARFAADFALAERQSLQPFQRGHAHTSATRVTHANRVILLIGCRQQLTRFALICRAGHAHIGNAAHKGDVIRTGVGCPIGTDQTCAIQRKHHRQILQRHVMNQLVISALQKGGIDCNHWLETFTGHAARKRHCMLLGNAYVVITTRKALVKLHHARAFAHGRRNAHQSLVLSGHIAQPVAEHLGKGLLGRRSGFDQPHSWVELAWAVIGDRVGLGQLVALTFFGHHMQKLRALQAFDVFQRGDQ